MKGPKRIFMGLAVAVAVMLPNWALFAAGPLPVNLGSTGHFAILAGAAITSTGGGIIDGDVGASPIAGSAIGVSQAQVNGIIYAVDASGPAGSVIDPVLLTAAKGDLTVAFNDAAGRTPVPTGPFLNPNGGNIGGLNLVPGLYKFTSEAHIEGSDVTLTGGPDDVWIFQIATALIMGADGRQVILAGGAQAKNVFWQVGSSATIGTFAVFKGTVMADQSITMDTSSRMEGRALAFSAGVTFNGASGSLPTTNSAPVAVPDAYATAEDTTLTITAPGVLANDTDADGDALTAIQVTGPAHGTLTLNADGSFIYVPAVGYLGGDIFTYKANDGTTDSNVTTVTLTVVPAVATSLQVFIEPTSVTVDGAQWRRVGTTVYHDSGFIETGLTAGPAVVEFKAVSGWVAPANWNVTVLTNQAVVTTGTYTLLPAGTGAVRVTIVPAGAVAAGAQWRLVTATTTTLGLASGHTEAGLAAGPVTVEFNLILGWDSPANQGLVVVAGQTTETSGTYVRNNLGDLRITITPAAAVAAGAQWRRVGTTLYFNSGATEIGLTSGTTYAVEFKPITGWIAPANLTGLVVLPGLITQGTGAYTLVPPVVTALQVFIEPTSVTVAGAQCRRVGTTVYHDSGFIETGLTAGPAVVEFKAVAGWVAPANRNVAILTDWTVVTTGIYTAMAPATGAVRVTIGPAAAIAAGAQWRRVGTTAYLDSGAVEIGVPAGTYAIEFKPISGWTAPPNLTGLVVLADGTTQGTGTYTAMAPDTGAMRVIMRPAAAIAAKAQWRRVGTTTDLDSGTVELGVPPGTYTIRFKPISGWTAPPNLTGLVVLAGRTALGTGTYTIVPPGITANYKVLYNSCTIVKDPGNRGLTVTGANAAIINIQKLKILPKNHNDVAGKVLYMLDSPGIDFLNATGTIKSLAGIGAFIGRINADVTGSIRMGVADMDVAAPATSIFATSATLPTAKTLKVSLTGVSLNDLFTNPSSAAPVAIKISAKKVGGVTVPAGVTVGAQIRVGNGLSLDVIGGNIYADLIESQGGIKSLTVKNLGQLMGGDLGQAPTASAPLATTLETLGGFLTPAALAVVQHPATPIIVSGLHDGPSLATDGIGKIFASTVHGVFVAGANSVGDLIEPRCDAAVKSWKATNASGDDFVSAPAKTQPAGIVTHTTAP